ncbi:hypothetical protein CHARACLAT_027945 [Characodon lateralis]|uniref:Uncharacterized protein n=1 Tax=Characodon lateralis TaxID=208331 RepID=A0ABU7F0H9_9TELE|nr:hypothetical protein [Characodon lateralis]
MSLSFLDYILKVTLDDQVCLHSQDSYPVIYLRLDSHQAGSFLSSSSPEPSHKRTLSTLQRKPPHIELVYGSLSATEQHQVNSLRIYLLKTWILNLIPPGDLTIITQTATPNKPTDRTDRHHVATNARYFIHHSSGWRFCISGILSVTPFS